MKKKIYTLMSVFFILLFTGIFFHRTLLSGKLPIPSDTLVGMYHPWLDYIAKEYPAGMPFKNFLITDPIRQQIPWRKLTIEAVKNKNFRAWNPFSFSGTPLSTNIQTGFYYPLNILFFFLPFSVAWTVLVILQVILSGIFMYLFLKKSMQLSFLASLFGALCFMFCGFSIAWLTWGTIVQTLLWLPLILLLSDRLVSEEKVKSKIVCMIGMGLVLAVQYFAGHSQVFLYSCILLCVYILYRIFSISVLMIGASFIPEMMRKSVFFAGSLVLFALLTAFHWIPFLSDLSNISRLQNSAAVTEGFFIPYQHLVQFIIPDFFGNPATLNYWGVWNYGEFIGYISVVGLFFVFYSIFSKQKSRIVFWFSVVIIGFVCALPTRVALIPYTLHIPFFSALQPTRLLSIIDFGLCILAALGLNEWLDNGRKKYSFITLLVMGGIFSYIWYITKVNIYSITAENLLVTQRNIIFPTIIFGLMSAVVAVRFVTEYFLGRRYRYAQIFLVICMTGITFFDLMRFGWKFTPFTDRSLFFPKTEIISFLETKEKPFRIASLDDRIMPPNVSSYYDIESIGGYDPLYDSRYEAFIAAMERGEPNITPPYGFNRIMTPKNISSPLFQLLGVRYILSLTDVADRRFTKLLQEGQTRLYDYNDILPRAYLLENIEIIYDEETIIKALYRPTFQIGKDGIVEEPVSIVSSPLLEGESAVITNYQNAVQDIAVKTETERILFIGNIFHRNWKAYIDGKAVPIFRINYVFIGTVVPKGEHTVQLRYE